MAGKRISHKRQLCVSGRAVMSMVLILLVKVQPYQVLLGILEV